MKTFLLGALFFVVCIAASAQTAADQKNQVTTGNTYDPRLLLHYQSAQLDQMRQSDTAKFNMISYYYLESYIFQSIPAIPEGMQMSLHQFDIAQFEKFRKRFERVTMDFPKYGIRITFLSVEELKYKMPHHRRL
jgi:uncharacterized protein involved in high-affinity Fe2+ transport